MTETMTKDNATVIPVLGMHRSGTSMFTRAINLLGVELGEHLVGSSVDNPVGYWESGVVQGVNRSILLMQQFNEHAYGTVEHLVTAFNRSGGWDIAPESFSKLSEYFEGDFGQSRVWGWKDPRTVVLFPFWVRILLRMGYRKITPMIIVRHPGACVRSMLKRGEDRVPAAVEAGLSQAEFYLETWKAFHALLMNIQKEFKCYIGMHHWFLDERIASSELQRCADFLGLDNSGVPEALDWIKPGLVHHQPNTENSDQVADELYQSLEAVAEQQRQQWGG